MRVPFSDIDSPAVMQVHLCMINEPGHWSHAAAPSSSFTDGFDPDYTHYFEVDRSSPNAPSSYVPLP